MTSYSLSNIQDQQMPTNVVIANQIQHQQNEEDPTKTLVRSTLRAITGLKDIMPEKAIEVYSVFKHYDYIVLEDVSRLAIERYDDPFNKYPSKTFWRTCVSDVMRSRRLKGLDRLEEVYKPTEEERVKVANKAREMCEYFARVDGKEVDAPKNLYEQKVDRYKDNAKNGKVLVRGGALDGIWLKKEEAERDNHNYICPVEWLASRDKKRNINNL